MTQHTRISRFVTSVKEARERVRERREEREEQRFEQQKGRLEREGEIEQRRATIRKAQAVARPKGMTTGEGFGQRFVRAQQGFFPPPQRRTPIRRRVPRKAARGRVFFDEFGRPVAVSNAPSIRRARKRRKARMGSQQSPFAPTLQFGFRRV